MRFLLEKAGRFPTLLGILWLLKERGEAPAVRRLPEPPMLNEHPTFAWLRTGNKLMYGASIRLQDGIDFAMSARFAIASAYRHHSRWEYLGSPEKFHPIATGELAVAANWMDMAPLAIYSSLEHCGEFIAAYETLNASRGKHESLIEAVHRVLTSSGRPSVFRAALDTAYKGGQLKYTTKYRNKWVHGERPRIRGLGIQHSASGLRVKQDPTTGRRTVQAGIGGGAPTRPLSEVLDRVGTGYTRLAGLVAKVVEHYEKTRPTAT